jgi:alcohol dehydrogenase class IV
MFGEFSSLPLEKVHFGAGSLATLAGEVDLLKAHRVIVITGRSLAKKTPLIRQVETILGPRHSATFSEIQQHVPESGINAAFRLAIECNADLLVSVGGGSPIDAAKAVSYKLAGPQEGNQHLSRFLPHIAISTTLSAAEFSHSAGFTDERTHSKTGISDPNITPRVVILDPEVTIWTPQWLWLASGVRSVDHAIETLYSPGSHPINDALALKALKLLFEYLPCSKADPENRDYRLQCQLAAWMSNFAPLNARSGAGLSHTIGKRIGATFNVAHGITSCILLPHVIRLKADLPVNALCLAPAAQALNLATPSQLNREAALAVAGAVSDLVRRLELPARLRDVNVPESAFPGIADSLASDPVGRDAVIHILEQAW